MLKLNRKIEYALMALQCLHRAHEQEHEQVQKQVTKTNLTAKEVAEQIGAPFEVAARVMQVLAQNQWLKVEHGAKGGYRLQKNLDTITMKDLIEMMEGPLALVKCQSADKNPAHSCEIRHQCQIISPMQQLNTKLAQFYADISLNELLGAKHV